MAWIRHKALAVLRGERATAAIEFGLAVPLLLALLIGVVELGFAIYEAMQAYDAAEVGAIYAGKNGWSSSGISTAVTSATSTTGVAATPAPTSFWGCPSESGVVSVASSSSLCAGVVSPGQYVQINASISHSTILPYPGLSLPTTFSVKSIIRLN